jgi:hypothetical protein
MIDLARIAQEQHPGVDMELATSLTGGSRRMRGKLLQARAQLAAFVRGAGWSFDPRGQYVYLLWGPDSRCPLYVGRSGNLMSRLAQHQRNPDKADVVRVQVIPCANFAYSVELESQLIRVYQPPLNKAGKSL